jgi:hypothetical protein
MPFQANPFCFVPALRFGLFFNCLMVVRDQFIRLVRRELLILFEAEWI